MEGSAMTDVAAPDYPKPEGASATSIWVHLCKPAGVQQQGDYPQDERDFRRCETFLNAYWELRERFPEMAQVNAYWASLVKEWHLIAAQAEGTKSAHIAAIIRPIQRIDPGHVPIGKGMSMRSGPITFQGTENGKPLTKRQIAAMQKKKLDENAPELPSIAGHNSMVAAEELRQFIERFEQLESEKKDVAEQQKELMAEAKGRGYDTKVMRKVIALRKRTPDDIAEEESILELYKAALGMA
jgi:uncharacterized protein (UPF0335 family)